ncbi:hypothetical protein CRUP_016333, partial [Coryphaenoides rupestris]
MADSASESDTDGAGSSSATPMSSSSAASNSGKPSVVISQFRLEELTNRLASLQQENKVLKIELETFKLKCKALQEENRDLRKASVTIQARAEQEEEFISNTLFKKIQALQKEKETLAVNYEKEEEFLTNELSRKLMQLQHEKAELEQHLEQEQEFQVNKLMKKIKKMENDTISKQLTLEQLRREKIDLENTLEQEQEALVNRLWKRMDKLEAEKRKRSRLVTSPGRHPRPGVGNVSRAARGGEGTGARRSTSFFRKRICRIMFSGESISMETILEEEEEDVDNQAGSRLSYGGHTVGFTPPATLSRAAISHYNPPALHVHGGSSHAVA